MAAPRTTQRVLVIDDSVDITNALRTVLEFQGYNVEVAFDGEQGLERARTFAPHVVLCDIGLPKLDGYQLSRRLRAEPGLHQTKILAITGHDEQLVAASASFDGHLIKPILVDELLLAFARLASVAKSS